MRQHLIHGRTLSIILFLLIGVVCFPAIGGAQPVVKAEVPSEQAVLYGRVADRAIEALVKGDAKMFKSMLSPGTIRMEQRGADAIDTIIAERFIPYFQQYSRPSSTNKPFPTYRRIDNVKGVGFSRSFFSRDNKEHQYVIFVLEEKGTLTVGNLLIDKNLADVQ